MAQIKHIAIATQDAEKTAKFYKEVFGLKEVAQIDGENAKGFFLSDGNINLAILDFQNDQVAGAERGKAIIVLNPADPALMMRNTVYCEVEGTPDQDAITASVHAMIKEVQRYVPGYKLVNGPDFDGNRVAIFLEVAGLGDFLPTYAGNLDVMTAAAARTAEMFAERILDGSFVLPKPEMA